MTAIDLIIVVWGEAHTSVFIDVGLPSLMAPRNIPGMAEQADVRLRLYTKRSDFSRIVLSAPYIRLRDLICVDIEYIDEEFAVAPHLMMSTCHRAGLQAAHERNAYAAFIPPECVWSDGSMLRLAQIAQDGVSIVHMSGLRLRKETAIPALAKWRSTETSALAIPARDLVRIGLDHLHPITLDLFYREHGDALMPANLLWTVPHSGILARCFHLHPLLVEANSRSVQFKTTIDDDLGLVLDPAGKRDYVVTDSDEIFAYELSPLTHQVQAAFAKNMPAEVAAWAEVGMNARHRLLAQKTIRIHYEDIDAKSWSKIERESKSVIDQALRFVDMSIWQLAYKGLLRNLAFRRVAENQTRSYPESDPRHSNKPHNPTLRIFAARQKHLQRIERYRTVLADDNVSCAEKLSVQLARRFSSPKYFLASMPARMETLFMDFLFEPHRLIMSIFVKRGKVRPWHWRWSYETSVLHPLKRHLAPQESPTLFLIDRDASEISFNTLDDKGIQPVAPKHAAIVLATKSYSSIMLSRRQILMEHPEFSAELRKLLLAQVPVRIITLDRHLTPTLLANQLGIDVVVEGKNFYGRSGDAFVIEGTRYLKKNRWVVKLLYWASKENTLRRRIFFPVMLVGVLIVFPITSLFAILMNLIDRRPIFAAAAFTISTAQTRVIASDEAVAGGSSLMSQDTSPTSATHHL